MHDHRNAIGGDDHVELDGVHADPQRALEGGERVLRRKTASAAVALQVEGLRGRTSQQQPCGEADPPDADRPHPRGE